MLLSILLLSHSFLAEEPLSVGDTFEEKSYAITELVESNLESGINAVAMDGVDNVEDIIIDNDKVVFDWCKMSGILDGSGALDSTTGNGYDSSLSNKVVRTHDSVTYQINLGLQLTEEANENVYRSGELNVRFTLPVTSDKARFDTRSLAFFKDYNIQNVGGSQVLTGKFVLPTNSQGFAIPCATRCDVTIAVKDMQNGSRLQPTFEFSSKSTTWEHRVVPDPVTVTCRTYYELSAGARTVNQLTTRKDYTGTNRANTSSGAKNVLLMKYTNKIVDMLWCGDNCDKFVEEIAREKDLIVFTTRDYVPYERSESEDFRVLNSGKIYHYSKEYLFDLDISDFFEEMDEDE